MFTSKMLWQITKSVSRWLIVALLALQIAAVARSQSTASLSGTVTDPTGASVAGATVIARNVATRVESTLTTDGNGAYLFPSLPIGNYRLEVSASGFNKAIVGGLNLPVATAVTRDVRLEVGQVSQQVEISADAAAV